MGIESGKSQERQELPEVLSKESLREVEVKYRALVEKRRAIYRSEEDTQDGVRVNITPHDQLPPDKQVEANTLKESIDRLRGLFGEAHEAAQISSEYGTVQPHEPLLPYGMNRMHPRNAPAVAAIYERVREELRKFDGSSES